MGTRMPAVAGSFYPREGDKCRAEASAYVRNADLSGVGSETKWIGAIVPHAGWICSGAVAGQSIAALAKQGPVDVVVVFGAIHSPWPTQWAMLDPHGTWVTPGCQTPVPLDIQSNLLEKSNLFAVDERFHRQEHAVEVEIPLIQEAWPGVRVLPIEVPVQDSAIELGRETARRLADLKLNVVFLASSDLTHYGPNYRFAPAGIGPAALEWAKENDRRLLRLVTNMSTEAIVPEVRSRLNACGAGAIAATMAACQEYGARTAKVLTHATSFETLASVAPQPPVNAVGYASVVIG